MTMTVNDFLARHGIKHALTGNTQAVIVALPAALDPIRLVGDEDKHATLMYFGETSSLPPEAKDNLKSALTQAAKMFSPFTERITSVERLGNDVPPALVTMLSNDCLGQIRAVMQMDPNIRQYLKNGTQYPDYKPHLTLAHPDYQDEADLREEVTPLYRVSFDRLSLWWNDERVELNLNQFDMDSSDMAQSEGRVSKFLDHAGIILGDHTDTSVYSDIVKDFLAHHGVKGQKWGVRRAKATLDRLTGKKSSDATASDSGGSHKLSMEKMKVGSVVTMHDNEGNPKTMIKKKDGTWAETHLSADAERVGKTGEKEDHERSTREIQEANNRANAIKQYNQLFNNDPNAALRAQVDQLQLNKQLRDLTPQKKTAVSKLVSGTAGAFKAYSVLDKALGGELGKSLGSKATKVLDPEAHSAKVAKELLEGTKNTANVEKAVSEAANAAAKAQISVLKLKEAQAGS